MKGSNLTSLGRILARPPPETEFLAETDQSIRDFSAEINSSRNVRRIDKYIKTFIKFSTKASPLSEVSYFNPLGLGFL